MFVRVLVEKIAVLKCALLFLVSGLFLCGCVANAQLVRNKDAQVGKYDTVYLLAPKEDPRNVAPKVEREFRQLGFRVQVFKDPKQIPGGQGTGFLVTDKGDVLTCAHVLGDELQATVWVAGTRYEADVVGRNMDQDLALLKLKNPPATGLVPASFRENRPCRMGEDAYTIGFPMSRELGNSARLSKGLVSATAGLKDDPTQVQISAEIQPGSSGGPVFDGRGLVFGVVQKTLDPEMVYRKSGGALPQNVNFAIRSENVMQYIQSTSPEVYAALRRNRESNVEGMADSVVKVQSGVITDSPEGSGKLVARLNYVSIWDVWFRFTFFTVTVFDFDTQEKLFVAGQGRDAVMSNEDAVIASTFAQIRRGLGMSPPEAPNE